MRISISNKQTLQSRIHYVDAYMGYRDPVVIYVNYFFAFQDDKKRRNPADRAASLIQGALAFKDLVVGGSLEPEGFGGKSGPLCSEQYRYFYYLSNYT